VTRQRAALDESIRDISFQESISILYCSIFIVPDPDKLAFITLQLYLQARKCNFDNQTLRDRNVAYSYVRSSM
jgi:hypothetical protein